MVFSKYREHLIRTCYGVLLHPGLTAAPSMPVAHGIYAALASSAVDRLLLVL
jgi:hypothetical protein